jgi:DNA repair protein RAD16
LTGTPLQNRVGELYSLVRFLRMDPHAYYFCKVKGCECKSLCWNFGPEQRACRECGHAGPRHYSHFNQTVINPINRYGYVGDGRKGFLTLRNDILLPAQLRRTKAERAEDVRLPSLTINVAVTQMDEVERDFYESLYMLTRAKFDGYVKKGSVLHNYAHIFELLSRLRQTCDHPYLVVHSKSRATAAAGEDAERGKSAVAEKRAAGAEKGEARKNLRRGRSDESPSEAAELAFDAVAGAAEPKYYCGMCQDDVDPDDAAMTGCKHVFHRECIMQYASCAPETGEKVTCPTCRVPLTVDLQPSDLTLARRAGGGGASAAATKRDELPSKSILSRIDLSKYTSSTKVEALLRGLREMRDEDRTRETTERARAAPNKAIVFSQYTNMIEIVEWRLKKENFVIAKLLGSMPVTQRAANLRAFREDPSVTVILMSLKSGGEGLNLQTANRVFVLEPWWNPAVEMQAVMRAHRIGQTRPVIATRFCTADTIEERMFDLQKKKALVFEGCMDGNQASLAQLTEEDLQFLFKR